LVLSIVNKNAEESNNTVLASCLHPQNDKVLHTPLTLPYVSQCRKCWWHAHIVPKVLAEVLLIQDIDTA